MTVAKAERSTAARGWTTGSCTRLSPRWRLAVRRLQTGLEPVGGGLEAQAADVHTADHGVSGEDVDRVAVVADGPGAGPAGDDSQPQQPCGRDARAAAEAPTHAQPSAHERE